MNGQWTPQQIERLHQELKALDHGFYRLTPSRCEHGILMEKHCDECHLEYTNDPS